MESNLSILFEKALVQEIMEVGHFMEFREGDMVMDYGKFIKAMPIVLEGTLRVMRQDDEGREILLYYLGGSESCAMAYSCCMEARKSEVKAIAESDVKLVGIPQEKMDEWICKYPSWKSYIMNSFTSRFNELLKSLESIAFKKLDERLVSYLLEKKRIAGSSVIKSTHQFIADEMGTSRVVISRLLKQLENDRKLILYRNEIKLLNDFGK